MINPFRTHNPVADQSPPSWWTPRWNVNHLVFQGGVPRARTMSMTGGGFLPMKDLAGHEAPSWQPYAVPLMSFAGSGHLPSRPNFLTALGGPTQTTQF